MSCLSPWNYLQKLSFLYSDLFKNFIYCELGFLSNWLKIRKKFFIFFCICLFCQHHLQNFFFLFQLMLLVPLSRPILPLDKQANFRLLFLTLWYIGLYICTFTTTMFWILWFLLYLKLDNESPALFFLLKMTFPSQKFCIFICFFKFKKWDCNWIGTMLNLCITFCWMDIYFNQWKKVFQFEYVCSLIIAFINF